MIKNDFKIGQDKSYLVIFLPVFIKVLYVVIMCQFLSYLIYIVVTLGMQLSTIMSQILSITLFLIRKATSLPKRNQTWWFIILLKIVNADITRYRNLFLLFTGYINDLILRIHYTLYVCNNVRVYGDKTIVTPYYR